VKDPHTCRLSSLEVVTKHPAGTERPFFKHRANYSRKIICQGPSGPGIVREIRSSLVKGPPPVLHCRSSEHFWAIHRLKFGVDCPGFQPFQRKETNHRSLFRINPKRIGTYLKFESRLTRQIAKRRRVISREMRGMGTCYIFLLFTRWRLEQGSRYGAGYKLMDPLYHETFSHTLLDSLFIHQ
jgi:hypothetical protein